MKKYVFVIFLIVLLLLFSFTMWKKNEENSKLNNSYQYYKDISEQLNQHRRNKPYNLKITSDGKLGETKTLSISKNDGPNLSYSFQKCNISLNDNIITEKKLSKDTVAFIIGHEMGHCEVADSNPNESQVMFSKRKQEIELQSDTIGMTLALKSGYNKEIIINETELYFNSSDTHSHPDRKKRINNMQRVQWKQ